MIETLSANRADDAFGVWILEGRSRRSDHFFNLHSLYSQSKFLPVNLISIPEQIARRRVFREGFNELSSCPFSRRMRCNIEVDDLASVMQQNYETVQVSEGQCRNGEKVDGRNLLCMIGEKCLPSLRRRRAAPDSILRHSRFRKVETEKTKLYPAYTIDTFSLSITLSFNNHPLYAAGRRYVVNHKHRSASDQLAPTLVQPEVTHYGKEEAAPSVDSASGNYLSWRSQRTDCQSLRTSSANHKPETKKQNRKGGK